MAACNKGIGTASVQCRHSSDQGTLQMTGHSQRRRHSSDDWAHSQRCGYSSILSSSLVFRPLPLENFWHPVDDGMPGQWCGHSSDQGTLQMTGHRGIGTLQIKVLFRRPSTQPEVWVLFEVNPTGTEDKAISTGTEDEVTGDEAISAGTEDEVTEDEAISTGTEDEVTPNEPIDEVTEHKAIASVCVSEVNLDKS